MNSYPTEPRGSTQDSSEPSQTYSLPPDANEDAALQRVRDYEQQVLQNPDALQACTGFLCAAFTAMIVKMSKITHNALDMGPPTVELFEQLKPGTDMELKLTRQVVQLLVFQARVQKTENLTPPTGPVIIDGEAEPS